MGRKRAASPDDSSRGKAPLKTDKVNGQGEDGPGEFEDAWEDEYEEEDVVSSDEFEGPDEAENGQATDDVVKSDVAPTAAQDGTDELEAYIGQVALADDEELVPDLSSYVLLQRASLYWPCLSFDVLRDGDGAERRKSPYSACLVAGTQAASTEAQANEVVLMRWDNMVRVKKSDRELEDSDEDESDDSDDDEDRDGADEEATLTFKSIPHTGGVNRIRATPLRLPYSTPPPEYPEPYHVATCSDTGKVHIFDVAPHLQSLVSPASIDGTSLSKVPQFTLSAHGRAEGFALDWGNPIGASATSQRLLSGDINAKIFLTTLSPSGFSVSPQPFSSHTSSIEDLQWSPSEPTVFASCSADRSVRIWDIRVKNRRSVLTVDGAHDADVNVMSWNRGTTYLIATGGDEGGLKVWDLRHMKGARDSKPSPVAAFDWHQKPITSIEWHPTEDSCFAASCADDSVTLWDLSVEHDVDEMAIGQPIDSTRKVPDQLLFVHQGQKEIKEVHWHPQIPGTLISTALDGFNVIKTISV
ncbi:uncharacterized protein L969DRAFT_14604 [Mixia osmundae IAM 14324]|uniref:Glutamate-rich WD repeat-containing protein 1 n=1 Tax=Mixia osmundae (strain CBS 9802 / IAM 14324 / JCM 22182 / KY 12970) TaxID=764103 RepID=G7E847_MIXOS|nr:uncharacterized protein L969DRAFT_14604 [Mixia osmundae IAM 14324]KEI42401.1 hypothetical protein L969DRAFT_14604 [Mixia osmundae IAM 14324]GAA99007.1 hypothetical protein E5Q_05696 [Mixia osmundae IAM 14324]